MDNLLKAKDVTSRTPHGVRGLKSGPCRSCVLTCPRRTPHGVRGLKSVRIHHHLIVNESHPARGAWIEIKMKEIWENGLQSHPARGAWIEI